VFHIGIGCVLLTLGGFGKSASDPGTLLFPLKKGCKMEIISAPHAQEI
jgi:hypothetical protein